MQEEFRYKRELAHEHEREHVDFHSSVLSVGPGHYFFIHDLIKNLLN